MGRTYLKDFKFAPNQTQELEEKVMDLHKTHKYVIFFAYTLRFVKYINILNNYQRSNAG